MVGIPAILFGVIVLVFVLYYYYILKFDFWKKRGIPGPKPIIFFGTVKDVILQKKLLLEYYKEIYDAYKHTSLVGIFFKTVPILMINDPALIKDVLVTDAAVFTGRGISYSKKAEPIMESLFTSKGKESLHLRAKLTPALTPSKLKGMLPLLIQRSDVFKDWLDTLLLRNKQINCSEIAEKLTVDFSSVCLFGYDPMIFGDKSSEVLKGIKKLNKGHSWKDIFKGLLSDVPIYNKLYDLIGYYLFDNAELMQISMRFVTDIISYRKEYNIFKQDIINQYTKYKQEKESAEKIEMTDQQFASHIFGLFLAAFETSAVTISNTLYELALNHTIQDKLREEIRSVYAKNNGEITFDDINAMSYLDAVCKETMRRHPSVDSLMRQASSTYTFRNSQLTISKNQLVVIPSYGIYLDPEIYPKPEIYNPERFIDEAARSRQSMHYIPFGYGPRSCIGERFGILQVKMGLITSLKNYKYDVCEKTPAKLKYTSAILVQQPQSIYLKVSKIK